MIIYKVCKTNFDPYYNFGDEDEKYYTSKDLAEKELHRRREEWPSCPDVIKEIKKED
jgi:hypothetical protein